MYRNEVNLICRLGKDAELRHLPSGAVISKLTACTERVYRDRNGDRVKQADWHYITVVGANAPSAAAFRKGDLVSLTGRLQTRTFESNGERKTLTEIVTYEVKSAGDESMSSSNRRD